MLLLGVLAAQAEGAAPAVDSDFDLLETEILTGTQASVTFSSLGSYSTDYQHFQIRGVARLTGAVTADEVYLRFNGSSGSYRWHYLKGDGSSVTSSTATDNAARVTLSTPGASATSDAFGAFVADVLDPFSTSKYPTVRSLSGGPSGVELMSTAWYTSTAAISSILLGADSGLFAVGSRFSLYGLKAA